MARILVVDDDPDILLIVEHTLTQEGHQVILSSDPNRVAELAVEHHADAVILDIMMPGSSGFDALHKLRNQPRTGGIPTLFLSARAQSEDRVRGLREGADDYMTKPFDVEELVLRVERLVGPRARSSDVSSSTLKKSLDERRVTGQVYLGRYQALEVIGEGAMGVVFRGWDPRLKRPVALKTLVLDKVLEKEREEKIGTLLEEASTTARLNHPNIVAIYDADADSEIAYMAMEYVDGTTLADYLKKKGPLDAPATIALGLGIARGLAAAHEGRVVHHDIKPGNVLLGRDGSIKVSDFGVAHLVHALVKPADKVFGTVGYLPPETLQGEGYDERGDLFALGAVLYECLTGDRAFGGPSIAIRIYKTVSDIVVPPHELVENVPPVLNDLIMGLLEKDLEARTASAHEVTRTLLNVKGVEAHWDPEIEAAKKDPGSEEDFHSTLLSRLDLTEALEGTRSSL